MSKNQKYMNDLKELKTQFYLILERYKNAYPAHAATPSDENSSLYLASKADMDNIFKNLFILESKVNTSSGTMDNTINNSSKSIDELETRYSKDKNKLDKIRDFNLASYPMMREFKQVRQYGYVDIIYYIIGIALLIYFIWKGTRPQYNPPPPPLLRQMIARLPFSFRMTPYTAKRGPAFFAVIVGIFTALYTKK